MRSLVVVVVVVWRGVACWLACCVLVLVESVIRGSVTWDL